MAKEIIIQENFQKETADILKDTAVALLEGLTGIAASKREEFVLSVGRIFQGFIKGKFLTVLSEEWKRCKEKGKIKEDYQFTEQHQSCLQELLDFLDNDLPNEITFTFLKKLFLVTASEKVLDRESILPHQFMRICRKLSSGEILLITAVYNIAKIGYDNFHQLIRVPETSAHNWIHLMAEKSSLKYPELVELYELQLIDKGLLTKRYHSDKSGVNVKPYFRLTELGYEICSFIENYEEV